MKMTIIRGIPGSGKSTYAKKNYSCLILEQDMFFIKNGTYKWIGKLIPHAVAWCKSMAELALANGMDVCVVNTSLKKSYVDEYAKLADRFGAGFEVIRMNSNYGNVHGVPEETLYKMAESIEDWPGEKMIY